MAITQNKSDSLLVKEFTEQGRGIRCPTQPISLTRDNVKFIIRMVMSEMQELALTVNETSEESLTFMQECLDSIDVCKKHFNSLPPIEKAAEQLDAMVDASYYMQDTACKHGMNLSSLFKVVHQANMSKRWADGTFHRRDDGKIMKPVNWTEPDVYGEIRRQVLEGSWSELE